MFDYLNSEFPRHGCDHTLRLTQQWLESRKHDVSKVLDWLDTVGGFCDCEVLANAEEHVNEAAKGGGV